MPRICSICWHPERHEIEADLSAGIGYSDVARWYGASKHALRRDQANHPSLRNATGGGSALEVIALLDKAEKESTWNATLLTIREARRHLEELSWRCCSTRRCRHPRQSETPTEPLMTKDWEALRSATRSPSARVKRRAVAASWKSASVTAQAQCRATDAIDLDGRVVWLGGKQRGTWRSISPSCGPRWASAVDSDSGDSGPIWGACCRVRDPEAATTAQTSAGEPRARRHGEISW
jgi:hypothetical protein